MSGSQNRLSKKEKRKSKTQLFGFGSFCLFEFSIVPFYFVGIAFLLHFHNVILSQLLRIFNNPFASLLSLHRDLIEFHNLSNIAPDENVL